MRITHVVWPEYSVRSCVATDAAVIGQRIGWIKTDTGAFCGVLAINLDPVGFEETNSFLYLLGVEVNPFFTAAKPTNCMIAMN